MITYRGEQFDGYNGSALGSPHWHNLSPRQANLLFSGKDLIHLHIEGDCQSQAKSTHC